MTSLEQYRSENIDKHHLWENPWIQRPSLELNMLISAHQQLFNEGITSLNEKQEDALHLQIKEIVEDDDDWIIL